MRHNYVRTMMVYTHVIELDGRGVQPATQQAFPAILSGLRALATLL